LHRTARRQPPRQRASAELQRSRPTLAGFTAFALRGPAAPSAAHANAAPPAPEPTLAHCAGTNTEATTRPRAGASTPPTTSPIASAMIVATPTHAKSPTRTEGASADNDHELVSLRVVTTPPIDHAAVITLANLKNRGCPDIDPPPKTPQIETSQEFRKRRGVDRG